MFLNSIFIYSIPLLCIIVILIAGLTNSRDMFNYHFYAKRKRRHSQNSYTIISLNPIVTYLPRVPPEDDEDLIKAEISSKFGDTNCIELRLEQDLDSDNDN